MFSGRWYIGIMDTLHASAYSKSWVGIHSPDANFEVPFVLTASSGACAYFQLPSGARLSLSSSGYSLVVKVWFDLLITEFKMITEFIQILSIHSSIMARLISEQEEEESACISSWSWTLNCGWTLFFRIFFFLSFFLNKRKNKEMLDRNSFSKEKNPYTTYKWVIHTSW
jgi:hypothetical protein